MSERSIRKASVCVVGGAGFLGSHLVDHLIEERDCSVLVLDNLVSGHKKFIHRQAKFEHCDITGSEGQILRLLRHYKVQYVFNYAAWPYIPQSFERPIHVFNVNAMGALKVINAAHDACCEGILQVSSAEIYGGGNLNPHESGNRLSARMLTEEEPVVPHSSYGASKAAVDAAVQVRWAEAGTPVIALRQFNCVGPRETHPYVIPEIIQQLAKSNKVRLGNNSFRDFQYAGDAVRMAVELLERGNFGDVYNMGSESGLQIYDLARLIGTLMHHETVEIELDPSRVRPWEIWHLQSDNGKLYRTISARPSVSLEEALKRTIQYFAANNSKWDW